MSDKNTSSALKEGMEDDKEMVVCINIDASQDEIEQNVHEAISAKESDESINWETISNIYNDFEEEILEKIRTDFGMETVSDHDDNGFNIEIHVNDNDAFLSKFADIYFVCKGKNFMDGCDAYKANNTYYLSYPIFIRDWYDNMVQKIAEKEGKDADFVGAIGDAFDILFEFFDDANVDDRITKLLDGEYETKEDITNATVEPKDETVDNKEPITEKINESMEDEKSTADTKNNDIYTLDIFNISQDEGIDNMQYAVDYRSEDEAIDAAKKCANEYANDDDVINVSVMAGEHETKDGIFGETVDIFTASNKSEAETKDIRKKAGYVKLDCDYYADKPLDENKESTENEKDGNEHKLNEALDNKDIVSYTKIDDSTFEITFDKDTLKSLSDNEINAATDIVNKYIGSTSKFEECDVTDEESNTITMLFKDFIQEDIGNISVELVEAFPTWAVTYAAYGEDGGDISDSEKELVEKFMKDNNYSTLTDTKGEHYFSNHNALDDMAGDVIDALFIKNE